jgi:hypothetical protein
MSRYKREGDGRMERVGDGESGGWGEERRIDDKREWGMGGVRNRKSKI